MARSRRRPAWITIFGADRRPRRRFIASTFITTGIGSGTTATATSATRAFTRWTSPAGSWANPNYRRATAFDKDGKEVKQWSGASSHFENFIEAMRSRKVSDLNADIQEGFISSALCHTGNVSYRLGQHALPDEIREKIKTDKDA